jgi:hypothetical protein
MMATRRPTGGGSGGDETIFGAEKGVQRNVDEQAGQRYANRSPGQSNAARAFPSLRENFETSVGRDMQRVGTGLSPTGTNDLTRTAQQRAGGRAATRLLSRGALLGMAFGTGNTIGDYIEEKTGIGGKFVDAVAGDVIDKLALAGHTKAELSEYSKSKLSKLIDGAIKDVKKEEGKGSDKRVNKKDYPVYEPDTKSASAFRKEFASAKEKGKDTFSFEGREYNTKEKMAKGGVVKKNKGGVVYANCGASVKPAQKAKK